MTADLALRPDPTQVADYFQPYVDRVPDGSILETLERQGDALATLVAGLSDGTLAHAYQPGKWTAAQVVRHVLDGERVFAYRALCFARGEAAPQPGFDHEAWAAATAEFGATAAELVEEWRAVRGATLTLLRNLPTAAWDRVGEANGNRLSVRATAWLMAGHADHHTTVLRERYLAE